ncbi:MAG: hypothetical protein AAFY56_03400 [Pseudomonadota bacterium]
MTIKLPPIKGMTRECGAFGQRMRRPRKGKMRVAMRMARGIGPGSIARECRLPTGEIENWIAEDDFQELLECCRAMMDLPEEERLKDLTQLALDLLETAMHECDYRVAMFFYDQVIRGKNPGRVLAEDINRKVKQAAKPLDEPLSTSKPASPTTAPRLPISIERPYAGTLSAGRCRVRDEIIRAMPSALTPTNESEQNAQTPSIPALPAAGTGRRLPGILTSLPKPATAPRALLLNHPRDGPD